MINNFIKKYKLIPVQVKASAMYMVSNIISSGMSIIMLPLFTRMLTTTQYGQTNIYQSWASLLIVFLTLQLPYGSLSTALTKYEHDRYGYVASVTGITAVLCVLFMIIYLPFNGFWNVIFELPTVLMVLMVLKIFSDCVFQCWARIQQFEYKYRAVVIITIANVVLSYVAAYLLICMSEEKGYAKIVGTESIGIIMESGIVIYVIYKGRHLFNKEYWKYALSFNIPLIVYYLSQMVFNQSDRLMINYICGMDKAGIYGLAYTLSIAVSIVLNAINNSYTPWIYRKIKDGRYKDNAKIAVIISAMIALLLVCIVWLAPEMILIFAGENYYEAIWVVPPVASSILVLQYAQQISNILFFYEQKKPMTYATIVAATVNIFLNWLLIPRLGYYAAGYTTFVSYIIVLGMEFWAVRKKLLKNGELYGIIDLKKHAIVFGAFTALVAVGMSLYNLRIIRMVIVVLLGMACLINYRKLWGMFRAFRASGCRDD